MFKETCSCGATYETDEKFWAYVRDGSAAWRKDHQHETPPTIQLAAQFSETPPEEEWLPRV